MLRILSLMALIGTLTLGGCAWSIGGGPEEEVETHYTTPTLADELEALKASRQAGKIDEAEYQEAKAALLAR
jgi:hypothetical protein